MKAYFYCTQRDYTEAQKVGFYKRSYSNDIEEISRNWLNKKIASDNSRYASILHPSTKEEKSPDDIRDELENDGFVIYGCNYYYLIEVEIPEKEYQNIEAFSKMQYGLFAVGQPTFIDQDMNNRYETEIKNWPKEEKEKYHHMYWENNFYLGTLARLSGYETNGIIIIMETIPNRWVTAEEKFIPLNKEIY